jgi:hypothetical protein
MRQAPAGDGWGNRSFSMKGATSARGQTYSRRLKAWGRGSRPSASQRLTVFATLLLGQARPVVSPGLTITSGSEFLYGVAAEGLPADLYRSKWRRRAVEERDDGGGAPLSWSSFAWEGAGPGPRPLGGAEGRLAAGRAALPEL